MKKIVVTGGPIPGKLDSVKFITNRFKGGLSLKTAAYLAAEGFDVTFVCWEHLDLTIPPEIKCVRVTDVYDYVDRVLDISADGYILSAAVANLVPKNPYEKKFPSHLYSPGDIIDIPFEIAPRLVDKIKEKYPRSTLIAYKLFDGTEEELLKAAFKTLYDSKANLVFANNPQTCKSTKRAVTADGSVIPCNFEEHLLLIKKLLRSNYFRTQQTYPEPIPNSILSLFNKFEPLLSNGQAYGCLAVRANGGMFCSSRGKSKLTQKISFVRNVDFKNKVVFSDYKATLNAPLLFKLLQENPDINILLHEHSSENNYDPLAYTFPGTDLELKGYLTDNSNNCSLKVIQPFHGSIKGFRSSSELPWKK